MVAAGTAYPQTGAVKDYVKSLKGKEYFLKIDVVEVNLGFRGVDAANIYEDGTVSYRARVNALSQVQASNGEDFAEDARLQIANEDGCLFCAVSGRLKRVCDLPVSWTEQRMLLGFAR